METVFWIPIQGSSQVACILFFICTYEAFHGFFCPRPSIPFRITILHARA